MMRLFKSKKRHQQDIRAIGEAIGAQVNEVVERWRHNVLSLRVHLLQSSFDERIVTLTAPADMHLADLLLIEGEALLRQYMAARDEYAAEIVDSIAPELAACVDAVGAGPGILEYIYKLIDESADELAAHIEAAIGEEVDRRAA